MRFFKPFLITLIGLSVVLLAISSLLPGRVMTSRWVVVHGRSDSIMAAILDASTWPEWNLLMKDAHMPVSGALTKGQKINWANAGGSINSFIVEEVNPHGLATKMELAGEKPFRTGFSVDQRQVDSVQVVWYLIEELKWYPWEKVYGMMASDMKGPLLQTSLNEFKRIQEH